MSAHKTINLYREEQQEAWEQAKDVVARELGVDDPPDGLILQELAGAYLGFDFEDFEG